MNNPPEIYNLNSFCFFEIFKQIKTNCETCKELQNRYILVQYSDLINFVIADENLARVFKDWSPALYESLEINDAIWNRSQWIEIDFAKRYESLQNVSKVDKDKFWKSLLSAIEDNKQVYLVKLIYNPSRYYPEHLDRFEAVLHCLRNRTTLRELFVDSAGYSFQFVPNIVHLTRLELNVRMDAIDLVEMCGINPNLRRLNFHNTDLHGRLSDIVPYCHQLEDLSFTMKSDVDGAEYAALAKLPRLTHLRLKGCPQEGTLISLLNGLKAKNLKMIIIPNVLISEGEARALREINSLACIMTSFRSLSSITGLIHMKKLKHLSVKTEPEQYTAMEYLVPLIPTIRVGLITKSHRLLITYIKEGGFLRLNFRKKDDAAEVNSELISPLCQLPNVHQLIILGSFGTRAWEVLIQGLASKNPQTLRCILFTQDSTITCVHAALLASIRSLTTIICDFCHLEQMIGVKLEQLKLLGEITSRVDTITTGLCQVRIIHEDNSVTLILDFIARDLDVGVFTPLANLKNLKKLVILGNLMNGSLTELFECLVPTKTRNLEELEIAVVEPEELRLLTQISSLKVLQCGFFCNQNIELLAELNQLESLTITVHPKGSLTRIFNILADKNILQTLCIQRTPLTAKEVFAVSGIKSLKKLQLGQRSPKNKFNILETVFSYRSCKKCDPSRKKNIDLEHNKKVQFIDGGTDEASVVSSRYFVSHYSSIPANFELLGLLPNLNDLRIHCLFIANCLLPLMKNLVLPYNQKLCKLSLSLIAHRVWDFDQFLMGIEMAAQLENLTELYIENPEGYPLKGLLDLLKTSQKLRILILNKTHIDFKETKAIGSMKQLEKLTVGFSNDASFEILAQLTELKELEIISSHSQIENKMRPILRSCKKLRSILLKNALSHEFIDALLTIIKSERDPKVQAPLKLCCPLDDSIIPEPLDECNAAFLDIEQPEEENFRNGSDLYLHAAEPQMSRNWWPTP